MNEGKIADGPIHQMYDNHETAVTASSRKSKKGHSSFLPCRRLQCSLFFKNDPT